MTTRMAAQAFAVESVEVNAPLKVAFDYIANPRKLPEWTHAFKGGPRRTCGHADSKWNRRGGLGSQGFRTTRHGRLVYKVS